MKDTQYVVRDRYFLKKSKPPQLGKLDVELTERCNNDCIHCYINLPADDHTARARELTTEQIKLILDEAAALGCFTVKFTGGEPLLREDFEELYLYTRRLGLKVMILTNATLITPRLTKLFSRITPLEKVEITLYGMKKKSYEAVTRNAGSFEAAIRGVHLLWEKNVPFIVKGVLLPPNKHEIEEFESWAASIPWMDYPPGYVMFFDLRSRREPEMKNRQIEKMRLSPEESMKILTRRREDYIQGMREYCEKYTAPPGDKLFSCGAGVGGGCVDAYGYFQPCMLLRHSDFVYDLKKGSIKDALEDFFPKIREKKTDNPEYNTRCGKCFLKGLCEQCPAKSWLENGTLDTPVEYLCRIAHSQARYLGLLGPKENAWEVLDWKERIHKFSIGG